MTTDKNPPADARYAETFVASGDAFSKEQEDIALAAMALRTGALTERQLSSALATWTIHGSITLAEHLLSLNLLDDLAVQRLAKQAADSLSESTDRLSRGNGATPNSVLLSTFDSIDPSGTIARLMGIKGIAGAADATGCRVSESRYRLLRKIGQGGLGRVWLAFDEHLQRHVAVKEITASDQAAALERFRKEAEITGRLEHPGIVPIYQLGTEVQSGESFYAMRFLGKRTLHDSILEYHERRTEGNDDPMLIRQLLTDFVSICQAIGHAHSRKVIHRDLKPENIAIDSFGQVIVIDWGIAKIIDELHLGEIPTKGGSTGASDQSTLQGQVLGTPLYMAPEQAAGRVDELDERTDIYGLGAILFAILTGYAPHERTRELAAATGGRDLLSAIAARPTPSACEVHPEIDEALSAICAKAMARRQYARYQTASQLADDVQRWMAGEPVSAHRERMSQRVARWIGRHRIWSQVIAGSLIVGVVALATLGIAAREGHIAQRQIRFDEMRGYAREIEVQFKATAEELTKDARFMSSLPPIQAIIAAQKGRENTESEQVWRERLEMIYEGSLRANPDYVAITYSAVGEDTDESRNVVRVERNTSDAAYVRRVPASRLGSFDDAELFSRTKQLSPGDILLTIQRDSTMAESQRHSVSLVAATPVFDESSGDLFGIVAIEMDLLSRFIEVLDRVEQNTASIYITDSNGLIWVSDNPETGVDVMRQSQSIKQFIPALDAFFSSGNEHRRVDQSDGWIATNVDLDRTSRTHVGVVLNLWEQE